MANKFAFSLPQIAQITQKERKVINTNEFVYFLLLQRVLRTD